MKKESLIYAFGELKVAFRGFFFSPTSTKIPRHSVKGISDFILSIFSLYNVYFVGDDIYFLLFTFFLSLKNNNNENRRDEGEKM